MRRRNSIAYSLAFVFLILTILSWPTEQFDILAPQVTRILLIGVTGQMHFPNGTTTPWRTYLLGVVNFTGKGGISAGNPLKMRVALYVNETSYGREPSQMFFIPLGAFSPSIGFASEGVFQQTGLELERTPNSNKWHGEQVVEYNQEGTYYLRISMDNISFVSSSTVIISPESVTVAARTNSLLVSLTWAILLFAVLELRVDEDGCHCKNKQQNHDYLQK